MNFFKSFVFSFLLISCSTGLSHRKPSSNEKRCPQLIESFFSINLGNYQKMVSANKIRSKKPIQEGSTETLFVEYENGIKGVFKPESDDWRSDYQLEILAYKLSDTLGFGIVPTTIKKEIKGRVGSLQYFMGDFSVANRSKVQGSNREIRKLKFFDWVIANDDRSFGNFMINDRGNVVAIDHGLSFNSIEVSNTLPDFIKENLVDPDFLNIQESIKRVDLSNLNELIREKMSEQQRDSFLSRIKAMKDFL